MKQPLAPIFRTRRSRFEIDRCVPQLRAVQDGKIRFHALSKGHYPGEPMKAAALPGLNSIGYWDTSRQQDWGLDPHRNEGIEITFLETGAMSFTVDDRQFPLQAGALTITRPWQLHKLGAPNIGPGRLHWLILDVGVRRPNQEWRWPKWVSLTSQDRAELTRKLRHNENPVWKSSPEIAAGFRGLAECIRHWKEPHVESRATIFLNQLLVGILDAVSQQESGGSPAPASRQRTVELFLRDLADGQSGSAREAWTLGPMAAECGMGITAFCKYCRDLVNAGPVEFLNQCRLDRAARQMREEPERSITDIAFESGFNSSQYFATTFRKRFHVTPREHRRRSGSSSGSMASGSSSIRR